MWFFELRLTQAVFVCLCFCFIQQVLTQVLEEAGYQKDSLLVLSDFVKVLSHIHLPYAELIIIENFMLVLCYHKWT